MNTLNNKYDVIVIGTGHAGIEACLITSKLNLNVLVLTISEDNIGRLSCNPAIGGIGKGHLVKEIDALGGEMGKAADINGIDFCILNMSKGIAVQSPRTQVDKYQYPKYMQNRLKTQKNLTIKPEQALKLLTQDNKIIGVETNKDIYYSKSVIITTGTFLGGLIHIGKKVVSAGRINESASNSLSKSLKGLGFRVGRLKTGTPPRVDKNTINLNSMKQQDNQDDNIKFSYFSKSRPQNQINCYLTYTNKKTHQIVQEHINESPLYSGQVNALGPRYCPSLENKIVNFPEKDKHRIFIEPEALDTNEIYLNGLSCSLPVEVQQKIVNSIEGLENAKIIKPGYVIEYDFCYPDQLKASLETKLIEGLYFAGQINGTTGYEEAAAQGLIAGINSVLKIRGKEPFIMRRDESYIAVMIDDLITKEIKEPYRIMTSRAEYRLLLRCDNVDDRLFKYSAEMNLIPKKYYNENIKRNNNVKQIVLFLKTTFINKKALEILRKINPKVRLGNSIFSVVQNRFINIHKLGEIYTYLKEFDIQSLDKASINVIYESYIKIYNTRISKQKAAENQKIPNELDYNKINGLLQEAKEKLIKIKPSNLGQASRIVGVHTEDIALIMMYITKINEEKRLKAAE